MDKDNFPREGDLFQVVTVGEHHFELRYGYYEDSDRLKMEPVPIYPDLITYPLYTSNGLPLVTAIQIPCEYYLPVEGYENEDCCSCCTHYPDIKDEIGICQCPERRLDTRPLQSDLSEEVPE